MWLLKRKAGISFETFRNHYENSHARLGEKYLGHLLLAYRRNYVVPGDALASQSPALAKVVTAKAWDYDCITEWELADEKAFEEIVRTLSDPIIGKLFYDDEEYFLDRSAVRLVYCDQQESSLAGSEAPEISTSGCNDSNLWEK